MKEEEPSSSIEKGKSISVKHALLSEEAESYKIGDLRGLVGSN
jgi:hypothetical protein